jgi:RNA polymerase sigma factor (sigma-70 family)
MSDFSESKSRYDFGQTRWSLVLQAGRVDDADAGAARNELIVRYSEAVYRYLCAKLADTNAAAEIFSRFAERLLEIHPFLQRANREKGRFRDYLKAILQRMVIDYHRENQRDRKRHRPIVIGAESEPADNWAPPEDDADFRQAWKDELMNQAWKSLQSHEEATGKPYYSLVQYKATHDEARSEEMARVFSEKLGREFTAENIRKLLQRGKEMLDELLVEEVARSLRRTERETLTTAQIEDELMSLGLFNRHRRKALDRYQQK